MITASVMKVLKLLLNSKRKFFVNSSLLYNTTSLSWEKKIQLHFISVSLSCILNRPCFGVFIAYAAQKIKFSIKDLFSKCDQIRKKLESNPQKSLKESFIVCAVLLWTIKGRLRHYVNYSCTVTKNDFLFPLLHSLH